VIEPPLELGPEAVAEWERLVAGKDELSDRDRGVLAAYCQAHGRWKQAERALAAMANRDPVTSGLMIKNKAGNAIENPLVGIANRAMADMARFSIALSGVFSPSGVETEPRIAGAIVSQAEFARQHGVSRKTVTKWKAEGRLVLVGGDVDVEATDARLFDAELGKFRAEVTTAAGESSSEAKLRYTLAQAELKEIQLAEKRGSLVPIEAVTATLADELAAVRSRLLAMPGRLAGQLLMKSEQAEIEAAIAEEVRAALRELTAG
jgi:phage terminase Nu1 subunit (DNA packaging protein)